MVTKRTAMLLMALMVSIGVFSGCKELFHPESAENGNENGNGHNGGYTLSAPTGVTATAESSSSIRVSWNAVSGAEYYTVYRLTHQGYYSDDYSKIGEAGGAFYMDTTVAPETMYFYKVTAVNHYGESAMSDADSATTYNGSSSGYAPSTPTGVEATAVSSNIIQISWSAPSSGAVDEYYIYRAESSYGTYNRVGSSTVITSSPYADMGLSASTTYYYKVSAKNSYGDSSQSSYTSATTKSASVAVPSAPTNVSATALSSSSIQVTWNTVSGATEYYVYRTIGYVGEYTRVGSSSTITSSPYTDIGLNANTPYYYKVSAKNSGGESSQSSYASATTQSGGSSGPPAAPTVTVTQQYSQNISLSWGAVTGAASYKVYRGTSASSTTLITTTPISTTSHSDYGLTPGLYYYQVSAVSSTGSEGNKSAPKFVVGAIATILDISSNQGSAHTLSGSSKYFTMSPTVSRNYELRWRDSKYNSQYADIIVSAWDSEGNLLFENVDEDTWNGAYCTSTISGAGTFIIRVEPYSPGEIGTFYLWYYY